VETPFIERQRLPKNRNRKNSFVKKEREGGKGEKKIA
jgi:hypothetical protein